MKLAVQKRTAGKKTNELRREGVVPGVLYGQGQEGVALSVKLEDLQAILRNVKAGVLSTTVFELQVDGKVERAIVKDIQYHPATYAILHIDFVRLVEGSAVTLNVPLQVVGAADCAGVKLGGFIRQVIRSVEVSCLPKDIPQEFVVDVREMGLGQSKKLSDIELPAGVRPTGDLNQVAVAIGKRAGS